MWDLCDRAFGKDLAGSVRSLSSLLEAREEPLAILGVIASRLRDLIRVKSVPDSAPAAEVARAASLRFEWQAGRYRCQARRFPMPARVRSLGGRVETGPFFKHGRPRQSLLRW